MKCHKQLFVRYDEGKIDSIRISINKKSNCNYKEKQLFDQSATQLKNFFEELKLSE